MRKILAMALVLSLAISGAAFATDFRRTTAIDPERDWAQLTNWSFLNNGIWQTSFIFNTNHPYPGSEAHPEDSVLLDPTTGNILLRITTPVAIVPGNTAGPVSLNNLELRSAQATGGQSVINLSNILTAGTLTASITDGDLGPVFVLGNLANGGNLLIGDLSVTGNNTGNRNGLYMQATGTGVNTVTIGGVSFTVPIVAGGFALIPVDRDGSEANKLLRLGTSNATGTADVAAAQVTRLNILPNSSIIAAPLVSSVQNGNNEVFLDMINGGYSQFFIPAATPVEFRDRNTSGNLVLYPGNDANDSLRFRVDRLYDRDNNPFIFRSFDEHNVARENSITFRSTAAGVGTMLTASGKIILDNEIRVPAGDRNGLVLRGTAGNGLAHDTNAFSINNNAHSNENYTSLLFGGIESNENVQVVVEGRDFTGANNLGQILANSDGIRLKNVELSERVEVKGTLIPQNVHASRVDLGLLLPHAHDTIIDLDNDSAVLKGRTTIDSNNQFSDAEFTFGGDDKTITLDRVARTERAIRSGEGAIAESFGIPFNSNTNKNAALLFNSATISDLTEINAGGVYFSDSVVNGLEKVEGLAVAFNNTTVRAATGGLTISADSELSINNTAFLSAATADNPTVTVANKGYLYLADGPTLTANNGTIDSITVENGGTLWLEGTNISPLTPSASNIAMKRVNFEPGATLLVNASEAGVTYLAADFAPKGDMTLGINDLNPTNTTIAVLSLNDNDRDLTIAPNSTFAVTARSISNTAFGGNGQFRGVRSNNTSVAVLNVPATSTLEIGTETYVFDVDLSGTLALTSFPVQLSVPTYDSKFNVASTAKLDLTPYGRLGIADETQLRFTRKQDLLEIIKVGNPSTPYEFLYAKDVTGKAADIFNAAGVKMLFRPAPNNDLELDPDWIYSFPVKILYDSRNAGAFSISADIETAVNGIDKFSKVNSDTSDTPDTPAPTTGTINAPTPVNAADSTPATNKYVFTDSTKALDWSLAANQKVGDATVKLVPATAKAYVDGSEVAATAKTVGDNVVVTLTNEVGTDKEFKLYVTFGANGEYTSGTVDVSVGNGVLNVDDNAQTTYKATDGEQTINLTFTNKFAAAEGVDVTWTLDDGAQTGTGADIKIDMAKLSAGEHNIKVTATKGTLTASKTVTFTVDAGENTDTKGGSSGGCSAGVASLALLLAIPMLFKKR